MALARYEVTLQRTQYQDLSVVADSPEEAIEVAKDRAIIREHKWEDTTAAPECVTLRVRCPHARVTQNHDPEGIADCLDCHGDDWLDVEVPQ